MSKHKRPFNPFARDAVGGGVGGKHGLGKVSGAIPCACPESGNVQMMRFELPDSVDPRIIRNQDAWDAWQAEKDVA